MTDERRIVTILFADVAGSTALGEALDPEDMRALLARYYALAREVIESHGGTVEKFIGDAVMAIFGLPRAHGDDAERALAATEMLRARLAAEPALAQIEVRFGVSTGEVVASRDRAGGGGNGGAPGGAAPGGNAGDFLVTGDAVNLAARLQQAAQPGEILCSERTARAAARRFAFHAPRELQLRGKALQVNGYPLSHALPDHETSAAAAPPVPMIGRDADLEQLQLAARRAFTEGRPQLVSIIAPAGAGKTRLVEEFLARLPDAASAQKASPSSAQNASSSSTSAPLVAIAQCLPYGQRLTFWPLRAVLHRFVGLSGDAPVEDLQRRVAAWLAERGMPEPEDTAERLASTVGAAETVQPDRVAMFNAWRSAVQAAGSAGPVVIVFEDLHWSSDTLLDLVEHVMQPWAQLPILMIALTRPELLDRRPTWGGGKRNYTSIALEPLDDTATAELVRRLLHSSVEEVVSRVVARAEGNPFYAGELVRAVMEQAVDVIDHAAVEHALAHLPDTVHAAVLARLDLLPADERRVLQLGAVLGRSFSAEGVAALGAAGHDPAHVTHAVQAAHTACRALIERDLLRPSADAYVFRHILIREVAYNALARSERARLHAAAAAWLEARAVGREDAMAELVAFHWREGVALGGASAGADAKRHAVDWLSRAADAAFSGAATLEGLNHLRAAIDLAEPERLPELYERLGEHVQSGTAASAPLRKALALSEQQGRPPEDQLRILARWLMYETRAQGSVATRLSDDELNALRVRGRVLLAQVDPQGLEAARFLAADAFYPFWLTRKPTPAEVADAEAGARRAADIAEHWNDADLLSSALDALSGTATSAGDYRAALAASQRRIPLGRRLTTLERMDAYSMVTWQSGALGDFAAAEAASAEGLAQVQPGQEPGWTMHLLAWRIYTLTVMGRWQEVGPLGLRARQLWEEIQRQTAGYAMRGFICAAQVARSRGEAALADSMTEVAETILSEFAAADQLGGTRWRWVPLLKMDREGLENVVAAWDRFRASPDSLERHLSAMCDHGWPIGADVSDPLLRRVVQDGLRAVEIQLRRAIGLREGDAAELDRAAAIAIDCAAGSPLARVRYESARLRGDAAAMEEAIGALEAMGDRAQIALYRV
jgi:class 3 adenylate cyclase